MDEEKLTRLLKRFGKLATRATNKYEIWSVWPFNFFPDSILMDDDQITITRRKFFWTKTVIPIKFPDLLNVIVHEAPLFCTIEVVYKYVTAQHEKIPFMNKKDGREFQKLAMEIVKESEAGQSGGQ